MGDLTQLCFPAIVLPRDSMPCLVRDEKQFLVWPVSAFKAGLEGMEIVDSTGAKYVVVGAHKNGYPKPFFGFNLLCERVLCVRFDLSKTHEILSADQLRRLLPAAIGKALTQAADEDFEIDEATQAIADGDSILDVMNAYALYLNLSLK